MVVAAGLVDSEEMMVGHAHLVPDDGGFVGRLAVVVDGLEILLMGHGEIAAQLRGEVGSEAQAERAVNQRR